MSSLHHFRGYVVPMCLITGDADFEQFVLGLPEGFSTILLVFFLILNCLLTESLHPAHTQREKN